MTQYLYAAAAALALSLVFTPLVITLAHRFGIVAKPSQLRWHKKPTALLGGIGIYCAFLIPVLLFVRLDSNVCGLLLAATLMCALGLIDDIMQIKPHLKLMVQICISCLVMAFGISFEIVPIPWIMLPLTIFWIVGITNAFNLLDNMDGLSCGIAFIACTFLFASSFFQGMYTVALLCVILAASCLGFLRYNFNPARIFMGDCGSQFLGVTIAILAMNTAGHVSNVVVTLAIPVLILGVPIFDTTFVTLMRKFKGQPISQGGKDHTSHRLVLLGLSERKTVLLLYAISILLGALALLYAKMNILVVSILAALAVIIVFFFGVFLGETKTYSERRWRP